ncbi:MAG TPA: hypothetical protein VFW09_09585 [Solirubrobacteraceae bacterium]|nr:hypothetical protein [Solirubrobacteraceae bacterium]
MSAPKNSTETTSSSLTWPRSVDGISRISAASSAPPAAYHHVLGLETTQKMIHGTKPTNPFAPITRHTVRPQGRYTDGAIANAQIFQQILY